MSLAENDWQSFLSPDSDLPPDVFFLVKDREDGESKRIGAHRFLLASVSPVFRGMFYGPVRETGEVVEVVDTTAQAFDAMINYIYYPPGAVASNLSHIRCPQKLFELLSLGDKYQILKLFKLTSEALENLDIARENMIFTASVAKNYKEIFNDLSIKLTLKCLKFLLDKTSGGGKDICALIKDTVDNFPQANLDILRELIEVGDQTLQLQGSHLRVLKRDSVLLLAGWGDLVFFDTREHELSQQKMSFAEIPKLAPQWKIIFEFKLKAQLMVDDIELRICFGELFSSLITAFVNSGIRLDQIIWDDDLHQASARNIKSNIKPKIGEWTKIEISHERLGDQYFLAFSVDGREVGRTEGLDPELRNLTDLEIMTDGAETEGVIRRVIVLEKK